MEALPAVRLSVDEMKTFAGDTSLTQCKKGTLLSCLHLTEKGQVLKDEQEYSQKANDEAAIAFLLEVDKAEWFDINTIKRNKSFLPVSGVYLIRQKMTEQSHQRLMDTVKGEGFFLHANSYDMAVIMYCGKVSRREHLSGKKNPKALTANWVWTRLREHSRGHWCDSNVDTANFEFAIFPTAFADSMEGYLLARMNLPYNQIFGYATKNTQREMTPSATFWAMKTFLNQKGSRRVKKSKSNTVEETTILRRLATADKVALEAQASLDWQVKNTNHSWVCVVQTELTARFNEEARLLLLETLSA